jgi:hypothetical protein
VSDQPPVTKYRLTLTIRGNTLDEIEDELLTQTHGGFLLDSGYRTRDSWDSTGGRLTSVMEHLNPDQTPERYAAELEEWFNATRTKDRPKEETP